MNGGWQPLMAPERQRRVVLARQKRFEIALTRRTQKRLHYCSHSIRARALMAEVCCGCWHTMQEIVDGRA